MANLVWANTYISGYAMHKSVGIIVCSAQALHTCLCVFAPQLASIHWHAIGTKLFLLQESTDRTCLWACLLRNVAISFASEYHHHPSVKYVSTHQGISLGQKLYTYTVQKNIWWSSLFIIFGATKSTNCFVTIKGDFVFSRIVTTDIQKTLESTNTGSEHTYLIIYMIYRFFMSVVDWRKNNYCHRYFIKTLGKLAVKIICFGGNRNKQNWGIEKKI